MRPKDNLREDHGRIMKLFVSWQKMLGILGHPDQALLEDFEKCIDWVEVFIDKCHHGKEDEILFPAMASYEDPEVTSLIKDLHSEHQTGRSLLEAIKIEFKTYSQTNGLPAGLIQLCQGYIDLFRKHIRRENAQLLPLLEKCIPTEAQEQIAAQFEQYEQRTIGPKKSISD
ncbi:MAG: hemerythrin domain-containing protein [Desulfobacterales bacterium]